MSKSIERREVVQVEPEKLQDIRRFNKICLSLAEKSQIASSLPNTADVADQANRDNILINTCTQSIQDCNDLIEKNVNISPYHQRTAGLTNNQLGLHIDEQALIIARLKISSDTADSISKEKYTKGSGR